MNWDLLINLGEKSIRVVDKDGKEIALFHCSVAKDKAKLPAKPAGVAHPTADDCPKQR
jgi:hypothetical protein